MNTLPRRILVLGAGGLLGNAMLRVLVEGGDSEVVGTIRSEELTRLFSREVAATLRMVGDLEELEVISGVLAEVRPDLVVNCLALRRSQSTDLARSISVYARLPQRIAHLCRGAGTRFIQISSDGVFSGAKGAYTEADLPDAVDVYGTSKILGEVNGPGSITLRTSIIGPELRGSTGLLEWFLAQQGSCQAYTRAIFSGLPTVVLARLVRDVLIPRPDLHGIYHIASTPISKYDLLREIATSYGKTIDLIPNANMIMDRSLDCRRFTAATGYVVPGWPELIRMMRDFKFGLSRQ